MGLTLFRPSFPDQISPNAFDFRAGNDGVLPNVWEAIEGVSGSFRAQFDHGPKRVSGTRSAEPRFQGRLQEAVSPIDEIRIEFAAPIGDRRLAVGACECTEVYEFAPMQ